MKARTVALAAVTALAPLAVLGPAAADTAQSATSHDAALRIGGGGTTLARTVWHEAGDVLCVHAARQDALARFRSFGRVVQVTDVAGGAYWSCTPNLDVREDDHPRLVLRWKHLGVRHYAKTVGTRITT